MIEMYDESAYFDPHQDPNTIPGSLVDNYYNNELEENIRLSTFSLEELSNPNHNEEAAAAAAANLNHLQHQLGFDIEHELRNHVAPSMENAGWDGTMQEATIHHQQHFEDQRNLECYDAGGYPNPMYQSVPDLLNLLQLPRCTVAAPPVYPPMPSSSISFGGPSLAADGSSVLYDSSLHLGFPPPELRDLFNSLPQNYGLYCNGFEDRDAAAMAGGGEFFQEMDGRQFESTVLDYRRDVGGNGKGEATTVSFVTERHRREQLNEKYKTLRSLIPNPTKTDRASIVGDAIEYIKELRRTVEELKMLVEQKRRRGRRTMKAEDEAAATDMESSSMRPIRKDLDDHLNEALRSSWLQRKSKDSLVDVHIIDDEVNIKLTQKRRVSCLLSVAKALDELQLDLVHITGGNIVDHYIFMFNAKICEGSSVYAGAIAKKLLEAMDRSSHNPNLTFPNNF